MRVAVAVRLLKPVLLAVPAASFVAKGPTVSRVGSSGSIRTLAMMGDGSGAKAPAKALSPSEWREFTVSDIETLSHDTKMFRIALPTPESETGMVTASCLMVEGKGRDGSTVARPYTPTTLNAQRGYFELVIKAYPEGNVSSYMHALKPGDALRVKGPFPKIKLEPNFKKRIGMIAGGTGITPMYQCIQELLAAPGDTTELVLLLGNRTPSDILLRSELDALAAKHPRFKVVHKVGAAEPGWTGGIGNFGPDDIDAHLPPPSDENMIFVCGPPGLMKVFSGDKNPDKSQGELSGLLKDKGYTANQVYKF